MNSSCKLSIIIVSYNTMDLTDNCLRSIYNSSIDFPYEIIVVDNNSSDGSVEMIKNKYPQVRIIANSTNKLFAIANNQAVRIANGEYLLLLNSDTLVWGRELQRLVEYFDILPKDIICIGPKILNADRSLQSAGSANPCLLERICLNFKLYIFLPDIIFRKIFKLYGLPIKNKNIVRQVGWVSGACMLMRSKEYREVGGLNENVEFYGEEPEFGYRTSKLNYKTFYCPISEIIHLGGQSTMKEVIDDKTRLRRYALLQRETVGYAKSIWMSRIVLLAAYCKRLVSHNKEYFTEAIDWEKKVIEFLKEKKNEEAN